MPSGPGGGAGASGPVQVGLSVALPAGRGHGCAAFTLDDSISMALVWWGCLGPESGSILDAVVVSLPGGLAVMVEGL